MLKLIRLYIDSVLLGLAAAIVFLVLLVVLDVGSLRLLVLGSPDGLASMAAIVIFFGGLFSSVQFAVAILRLEVAQDRAIEYRRRHGWGNSPRDRKDRDR
jgi:hypothetical protein